ncbi:hypothetical protein [Peptostreptococcus faecalis]|uniref:hypothetical protein n=1 Tax=Peptostreptococcus faecalis TaxID=2045015 RepID=UPI000C7DE1F8|nr:hypothetical protein [Peptostreptococcus faecalis]
MQNLALCNYDFEGKALEAKQLIDELLEGSFCEISIEKGDLNYIKKKEHDLDIDYILKVTKLLRELSKELYSVGVEKMFYGGELFNRNVFNCVLNQINQETEECFNSPLYDIAEVVINKKYYGIMEDYYNIKIEENEECLLTIARDMENEIAYTYAYKGDK